MGARLDSLDLLAATLALPDQVAAAPALVGDVALPGAAEVAHVLVLGAGVSALAGRVVQAVTGPLLPVPVTVADGDEVPSSVDESTLVLALSWSGATEATVDAATTAAAAGGRVVAVSTGGPLEALASGWGAAHVRLRDDLPTPRAGLGALSVVPLVVLERIGLFPGAGEWVALAVEQLRRRSAQLAVDGGPAERLARAVGRTMPLVHGGGDIGATAAVRWKQSFNANAKVPSWASALPDMTHAELAGWAQHGDVTRQVFTLVTLRHDHEHPQVSRRFDLVHDVLDEVVADVLEVRAEGEGALAQLLDLALFGDVSSLHLAFQSGVDPGPTPTVDDLHARLAHPHPNRV